MNKKLYLTDIVFISAITILTIAIAIYGICEMGCNVNWYLTYKESIDELPYGRFEMISNITQDAVYSAFLLVTFVCFLTMLLISTKLYKKNSALSRVKEVIVYNILPLIGIILGIVCAAHWIPRFSEYLDSNGAEFAWTQSSTVLWFLYGFTGIFTAVFGAAVIVLNNILFTKVFDTIRTKLTKRKSPSNAALSSSEEQHKEGQISKQEQELEELKRNGK